MRPIYSHPYMVNTFIFTCTTIHRCTRGNTHCTSTYIYINDVAVNMCIFVQNGWNPPG